MALLILPYILGLANKNKSKKSGNHLANISPKDVQNSFLYHSEVLFYFDFVEIDFKNFFTAFNFQVVNLLLDNEIN